MSTTGSPIVRGSLVEARTAYDGWRRAIAVSDVEGTHRHGRKIHDFPVIWLVVLTDANLRALYAGRAPTRVPWPAEDVRMAPPGVLEDLPFWLLSFIGHPNHERDSVALTANMKIATIEGQTAHATSTSVNSNTEGTVEKVDVRLTFADGSPMPATGTEFTLNGHFDAQPATATDAGGDVAAADAAAGVAENVEQQPPGGQ